MAPLISDAAHRFVRLNVEDVGSAGWSSCAHIGRRASPVESCEEVGEFLGFDVVGDYSALCAADLPNGFVRVTVPFEGCAVHGALSAAKVGPR